MNKLIQYSVMVAVGVLVFATLLVPVINDAQTASADKVNYTNESTLFKLADDAEIVTISLSSGTVTLNGATVEKTSNSNILLSDAFSVDQYLYQGNWLTRVWYKDSTALSYPSAFELTFNNGAVTGSVTSGGNTTEINDTYTYLYYADANGKYTQISSALGINVYVNDVKDIVLSGLYYTGNNSGTYSYINGVLTVPEGYGGSISFESAPVGMDVYNVTGITVNVGDESFTPYRFVVPAEVIGHTATPTTDIIGVIPIVVIVGLIMGIFGVVVTRRMD